ncbi:MAG TPA: hypothetical protein VFU40_01390, partial [Gemmatimonadales bacterium]|nr:hypothetical protein [Gemmatimonadales bacterium]
MSIDQAGNDDRVIVLLSRHTWGSGNIPVATYRLNPPAAVDQEGPLLERRARDWNQPSGGQPARPHFSVAD